MFPDTSLGKGCVMWLDSRITGWVPDLGGISTGAPRSSDPLPKHHPGPPPPSSAAAEAEEPSAPLRQCI